MNHIHRQSPFTSRSTYNQASGVVQVIGPGNRSSSFDQVMAGLPRHLSTRWNVHLCLMIIILLPRAQVRSNDTAVFLPNPRSSQILRWDADLLILGGVTSFVAHAGADAFTYGIGATTGSSEHSSH